MHTQGTYDVIPGGIILAGFLTDCLSESCSIGIGEPWQREAQSRLFLHE